MRMPSRGEWSTPVLVFLLGCYQGLDEPELGPEAPGSSTSGVDDPDEPEPSACGGGRRRSRPGTNSIALTNASKHAPGSNVCVRVHQSPGRLGVTVSDDGPGAARLRRGHGLRGLAERVEAVDGLLQIDTAPSRGVTVRVELGVPR